MSRYVNNFKQKGLVLLTVLLFMMLFTLLGLFLLESSLWAKKMSQAVWQQQLIFMAAESVLKNSEGKLATCLIPPIASENVVSQPLSWWQSTACIGNFKEFQYYYFIEDLGKDDCADTGIANTVANYFRMTLMILTKNHQAKEILQSTFIQLTDAIPEKCSTKRHVITVGRQMWREIRGV